MDNTTKPDSPSIFELISECFFVHADSAITTAVFYGVREGAALLATGIPTCIAKSLTKKYFISEKHIGIILSSTTCKAIFSHTYNKFLSKDFTITTLLLDALGNTFYETIDFANNFKNFLYNRANPYNQFLEIYAVELLIYGIERKLAHSTPNIHDILKISVSGAVLTGMYNIETIRCAINDFSAADISS